jgi:hypothetical protein
MELFQKNRAEEQGAHLKRKILDRYDDKILRLYNWDLEFDPGCPPGSGRTKVFFMFRGKATNEFTIRWGDGGLLHRAFNAVKEILEGVGREVK